MATSNGRNRVNEVSGLPFLGVLSLKEGDALNRGLFSSKEWESIQYYKREEDRLTKAASLLLCSYYLEGQIRYNDHGKPFIENGPFFSLSHSYPYVVIAIAYSPIGVDVERKKKWDEGMSQASFSKEEMGLDLDPLRLWTLKEASYKIKGDHPFSPKDDEVRIKNETLLSFHNEEYYYRFVSDKTKELTIVSKAKLDDLQVETLSFQTLLEQRRTNHEGN